MSAATFSPASAPARDHAADPAFVLTRTRKLHIAGRCDDTDSNRFLSVEILRDPQNLQAQVRRILLLIDAGNRDLLPGALSDLFIALGKHGESLRYALLQQAEPLLDEEDLHFLRAHLSTGIDARAPLQMISGSLLTQSLEGAADLIERQRVEHTADQGVLAEANALLEEGNLEAARDLLENAVLATPSDTAIAEELLLIYRHSRDDAALTQMKEKLIAQTGGLPPPWDQA
jgi:hypothetical protein